MSHIRHVTEQEMTSWVLPEGDGEGSSGAQQLAGWGVEWGIKATGGGVVRAGI